MILHVRGATSATTATSDVAVMSARHWHLKG